MRPLSLLKPVALALLASPLAAETTLETARGPVTIEAVPQTVVALDLSAIDTLQALEVEIAGIPGKHYLSYLDPVAAKAKAVGSLFEPDFEALAMLGPDLILGGGRSADKVEALGELATTLDMTLPDTGLVEAARARLLDYGALFDKGDAAAALDATLVARLEAAKAAVAGKGDALILLTNGGKVSAYGAGSRFGWLHDALGLPEAHPAMAAQTHGEAVSFEFIAEENPDWLIVVDRGAAIGRAGEAASATLDNPLVAGTTAAQKGQVIYLSSGPLYLAGGGYQSIMITLDEIIAAFGNTAS